MSISEIMTHVLIIVNYAKIRTTIKDLVLTPISLWLSFFNTKYKSKTFDEKFGSKGYSLKHEVGLTWRMILFLKRGRIGREKGKEKERRHGQ